MWSHFDDEILLTARHCFSAALTVSGSPVTDLPWPVRAGPLVCCELVRAGRWGLRSDYNGQNYRISPQVFWGLGEEQTLAEIKDHKYHRASRETWWEKPECGNVAKEHGLHFSWTKSVNLAEPVGLYFLSQSDFKKILKKIFPLWEIESHLKLAFR